MAANDGPGEVGLRGALQHQIFADEIVERRQADGSERGDQKHNREIRRGRRDAAVGGDFERMTPLIQIADQHEQRAGGDAVIQHLIHRAVEPLLREGKNAEHDESQVAHRGIRHQLLHVGLHQGDQRSVNDAGDGEPDDPGRGLVRGVRGTAAGSSAPVRSVPIFSMTRGQHDGTRRGRFDVRVGQPGVQREQRDLDREGDEEGQEQQHLRARDRASAVRSGSG